MHCWKGLHCTRGESKWMLLLSVHSRQVGTHCYKVGNNSKVASLSTTNHFPSRLESAWELHHFGLLTHLASDPKNCPCLLNYYPQPCPQLFSYSRPWVFTHDFNQGFASCGHVEIGSAKRATDLNRCFIGTCQYISQNPYFSVGWRC